MSLRILADAGQAERPIGTLVALHGFTRQPEHLAALAAGCVESGITCVRPALAPRWAPMAIASAGLLRRRAEQLSLALVALPTPVVLVGHSAGAAAAVWIAATWMQADSASPPALAGIVLVDGVDSLTGLIRRGLPLLDAIPMRAVLAPPSPCNRHGALSDYLTAHRPGISEVIDGSGHGDIEGEERWVYARACGDSSSPDTRARLIADVIGLARLMLLSEPTS